MAIEGRVAVRTPGAVSGSLVLDAASIDTNNKKRDGHLRTADFLEVTAYPTIVFTLEVAQPKGAGMIELSGYVTIRQSTRPVTLIADVGVVDNTATVVAELDIDRSEWGVTGRRWVRGRPITLSSVPYWLGRDATSDSAAIDHRDARMTQPPLY